MTETLGGQAKAGEDRRQATAVLPNSMRAGRPESRPAPIRGYLLASTGSANIAAKTWFALPGCFTALA